MAITIQNTPFFCLLWIGLGFLFIMIGVFRMAIHNEENYYTKDKSITESNNDIQELFSYFLEEEEKKNNSLREMLAKEPIKGGKEITLKTSTVAKPIQENNEIIKMYEEGHSVEEIAKKLKKGIGEVNLLISLYSMR